MSGQLDPWDRSLYETLVRSDGEPLVDIEKLSEASGLSVALLQALERLGFLIPQQTDPHSRYDPADAQALKAGMVLLQSGVPLDELLSMAQQMDAAMRPIAARAVEVFARFVRDSVEYTAQSDADASEQIVDAYRTMLEATGELVAGHFRTVLLLAARATLEDTISS